MILIPVSWQPLTKVGAVVGVQRFRQAGNGPGLVDFPFPQPADLSKTACNRQRLVDSRDGVSMVK